MDSNNKHAAPALVLLSTYNGEKYLAEQLNSLIAQTYSWWICLIRDDGSTDKTTSIIQHYCQQDPRFVFLQDQLGNLRPQQSFSALMQTACQRTDNYIFFCDQDDVWLPTKLEKQIALLQSLEQQHGVQTPLLVHSDLSVADEHLQLIHASYLRYEQITRNTVNPIKTLLINNFVTGCTVGINKALLHIATPVPKDAFMHDWWCALCAACTGHIGFLDEATMLYRQHGKNSVGSSGLIGKLKELFYPARFFTKRIKNLRQCFLQADLLSQRLQPRMAADNSITPFAALPSMRNRIQRYRAALGVQLQPASKLRNVMFWVMLGWV